MLWIVQSSRHAAERKYIEPGDFFFFPLKRILIEQAIIFCLALCLIFPSWWEELVLCCVFIAFFVLCFKYIKECQVEFPFNIASGYIGENRIPGL